MSRNQILDWLGLRVLVIMDRPMGSLHPVYGFTYPVNYGHLQDELAGDGEEQDAYVLGLSGPMLAYEGVVRAVILRADDLEDKLVVTPEDYWPTREEISQAVAFQEQYFVSSVYLPGDPPEGGPVKP